MQAALQQLDVCAERSSSSKMEELYSSVNDGQTARSEHLSHELWAWEKRLDVNEVLSKVLREQSELWAAVKLNWHQIQQLIQ